MDFQVLDGAVGGDTPAARVQQRVFAPQRTLAPQSFVPQRAIAPQQDPASRGSYGVRVIRTENLANGRSPSYFPEPTANPPTHYTHVVSEPGYSQQHYDGDYGLDNQEYAFSPEGYGLDGGYEPVRMNTASHGNVRVTSPQPPNAHSSRAIAHAPPAEVSDSTSAVDGIRVASGSAAVGFLASLNNSPPPAAASHKPKAGVKRRTRTRVKRTPKKRVPVEPKRRSKQVSSYEALVFGGGQGGDVSKDGAVDEPVTIGNSPSRHRHIMLNQHNTTHNHNDNTYSNHSNHSGYSRGLSSGTDGYSNGAGLRDSADLRTAWSPQAIREVIQGDGVGCESKQPSFLQSYEQQYDIEDGVQSGGFGAQPQRYQPPNGRQSHQHHPQDSYPQPFNSYAEQYPVPAGSGNPAHHQYEVDNGGFGSSGDGRVPVRYAGGTTGEDDSSDCDLAPPIATHQGLDEYYERQQQRNASPAGYGSEPMAATPPDANERKASSKVRRRRRSMQPVFERSKKAEKSPPLPMTQVKLPAERPAMNYTPFTIKDYRTMRKQVSKGGGLGPNITQHTLKQREKKRKARSFGQWARQRNRLAEAKRKAAKAKEQAEQAKKDARVARLRSSLKDCEGAEDGGGGGKGGGNGAEGAAAANENAKPAPSKANKGNAGVTRAVRSASVRRKGGKSKRTQRQVRMRSAAVGRVKKPVGGRTKGKSRRGGSKRVGRKDDGARHGQHGGIPHDIQELLAQREKTKLIVNSLI